MVEHDKFEDVLAFLNKNIQEPENQFKSRSSWMRHILRTYAILSDNNRRRWENNKTIPMGDRNVSMPDLKIWTPTADIPGTIGDTEDGLDGELVGLPIGDLQYEYLKRAVEWENTLQIEVLKTGSIRPNVAILAQSIIFNQLLPLWAQVTEQKMRLEEAELPEE
jgi:hypothetical protein